MIRAMFSIFFWWLFPRPKIGERWAHMDEIRDPWNERYYTITKRCGNWYRIRSNGGYEQSLSLFDMVTFYRKTADAPPENDEPPF